MCSRRNKPVLQAVVFLGLLGSLGYFVYLYNTMTLKLERTDRQLKKYIQHQQSLSSQLQVVYEHRALLEKTYEKEKKEHKKTKHDLDDTRREFTVNFTRTKHETLNRFNSLETQHRMVKAQHEQLQLEYNRLQQQHARLSAEHQTVNNQQISSFNAMKTQKEQEINGLEAQINTLKRQVATWKAQYSTHHEDAQYYKNLHREQGKEMEKNKQIILHLYDRINKLQKKLASQHSAGRQQVKPQHQKEQPGKHPDRRHNLGTADSRPGQTAQVIKATVSTIKRDTRQRVPKRKEDDADEQPGDTGEETEDKDSENDDKGQQQGETQTPREQPTTKPKYGVRPDIENRILRDDGHGGGAGEESRGSNEPPVILQATHREPTIKATQAEVAGADEYEQQKVQRYLSQNIGNALQQQLQQQLYKRRQQQHQQQQQKHQQQQQEREQQEQQQQEQQRQQQQQQQEQRRPQQQQTQEAVKSSDDSRSQSQPSNADRRTEDNSQEERTKKSDLSRSVQQKDFKNSVHERLSKLKDKLQANSQKSSRDNGRSRTADKREAQDSRKAPEVKNSEHFRRPIPRPGGGAVKRTGGESERESRDSDIKKGGAGDAPEEEMADDGGDEEENENDDRENNNNNNQEQENNQDTANKSPDKSEDRGAARGLRQAT